MRSRKSLKGLHHHFDPLGELVDHLGMPVDQFQVHAGQESMMGGESAGKRFGQLRNFGSQAIAGQISHRGRVGVAGDEGFEHQPPGYSDDIGGHRRQLDPGVFQHLFQPLDFSAPFSGDRGAGAGQIPQLPDRRRRDERSTHQTVGAQLRQPGRIIDIGLAARQVLHMPGIDQHHLHPRKILQQVVERFPVVTSGLHHHACNLLGHQVISQREDLTGRRSPRRHRLHGLAPPRPGDPDADLGILF